MMPPSIPIPQATATADVVKDQPASRRIPPIELVRIELGLIVKEHRLAAEVRKSNAAFLRQPPVDCITLSGLRLLAEHAPLHVVPERNAKFTCIGGLLLFRLLQKTMQPADKVYVIIHRNLSPESLQRHIEADILLVPVLFGLHPKDRRLIAKAWTGLKKSPFAEMLKHPGWKGVSHILACEIRPKKVPKANPCNS